MSHCDIGPWNTVYRDGLPVAFIDWAAVSQPVDPLLDVAAVAWAFVPPTPGQRLVEAGFDPLPDFAARLRSFVDSYGGLDRSRLLPALVQAKLGDAERIRYCRGATDSAVALEFVAAELRWPLELAAVTC